jgi:hypothetical protein
LQSVGRVFDLIVLRADSSGVKEMFGAQRERSQIVPGAGAIIKLKRLPTSGGFDQSSLEGPLAITLGFESQVAVGFGIVTADGKGNLTNGELLLNAAGVDPHMPTMKGQMAGTYTVIPEGMVNMHLIISLEDGEVTEADYELMIVEAQDAGNGKAVMMRKANWLEGAPTTYSVPGGNWTDIAAVRRFRVNLITANANSLGGPVNLYSARP